MSTHTPGPWDVLPHLSASENHKGFRIWRDRDGFIADVSPRNNADGNPSPSGIANANLIAAAPDLLAALDALCDAEEQYGDPNNVAINEAWQRAMEVSRKARGV